MTDRVMDALVEVGAQAHHDAYERLAPSFGWPTNEASRVPWEQLPEANRQLMLAAERESLTAQLVKLISVKCETCEGHGEYRQRDDKRYGEMCIACHGSGSIEVELMVGKQDGFHYGGRTPGEPIHHTPYNGAVRPVDGPTWAVYRKVSLGGAT